MEIKTKFNVGDKVWVTEPYYENNRQYYKPLKIRITNIVIDIDNLGVEIRYLSVDTQFTNFDDTMFKTKEQAQAECDKRNYKTEYKQIFEKCLDEAIEKTVNKGE